MPVNPNYVDVNVQNERSATKSHLNVYKALVELRKSDALKFGDLQYGVIGNGILVIKRYDDLRGSLERTLLIS